MLLQGLILLYLTALGKVTRSLSFQFNIIGVLLIAVGEAGVRALLREFIANQLRTHEPKYKNEDRVEARTTVFWRAAWCFSVLTTYRIYNSSWPTTFIFSASATAVTLIFFLCSIIWFYRSGELAASGSDSASAIRERLGQQGQEMECYKHQNKPKVLLNVIPMWTSFLVFYLIVSTGETFFPEQGDSMRSSSFYVTLLVIQSVSSKIISFLFNLLLSKWVPKAKKKHATLVRIWAGMVLSTLVCAVTWRVEVHRLIIVNISKGLLTNNPDAELPMSIFWLAPQFCLLGLMEGLAEDGLEDFMIDRFPLSWREYVSAINELLFAIGSFISILCVHANRRLFGSTLNSSRLDEYYKRLTVVSFVNLCYYWYCIYTFYTRGPGTDVD